MCSLGLLYPKDYVVTPKKSVGILMGIMERFYDFVFKSYSDYRALDVGLEKRRFDKSALDTLKQSHFFPKELYATAIKTLKHVYVATYETDGINIQFEYVARGNNDDAERVQKLLHYMNFCILLLKKWSSAKKDKMRVMILDIDYPRRVPADMNLPTPLHVNGGVTYVNEGDIYVFRREDMLKVLIHELVHYFDLDYKWATKAEQKSLGDMLWSENINANEAFVDSLAVLLNTCLYCIAEGRNDIQEVFAAEMDHVLRGALCLTLIQIKHGRNVQEKSNASSYYILKAALLMNPDYFGFLGKCNYSINDSGRFKEFLGVCERSLQSGNAFWRSLESMWKSSQGTCVPGSSLSMTSLSALG